jgi:hypothetical protein
MNSYTNTKHDRFNGTRPTLGWRVPAKQVSEVEALKQQLGVNNQELLQLAVDELLRKVKSQGD